jgi:hypothetical protein
MPNQVRALRSSTSQNRPTGRLPGELYVNFADNQLGTINPSNTATDLIAVRYFSLTANYFIGDHVIYSGILYRALAASNPGPFVQANWSLIGGAVTVADAPPANPQSGQLWFDSVGGQLYVFYADATSSQWVIAVNIPAPPAGGGGASITVGDIAPTNPVIGSLWWNSAGGQLYVWYNDGSSSQWVPATNQMGGGYLPLMGVTNGLDAPAGQIGEVVSATTTTAATLTTATTLTLTSIPLGAGDWDVSGEAWFTTPSGASLLSAGLFPQNTFSSSPSVNASRGQFNSTFGAGTAILSLRTCRASLAAPGTYYLLVQATFAAGTVTALGNIWARRAR